MLNVDLVKAANLVMMEY